MWGGIDKKMTYIVSIYSFDLAVKCEDFIFHLFEGVLVDGVSEGVCDEGRIS